MYRPVCPRCHHAHSTRLAHRRRLDGLLRLASLYAFRCETCSTRFYRIFKPERAPGIKREPVGEK